MLQKEVRGTTMRSITRYQPSHKLCTSAHVTAHMAGSKLRTLSSFGRSHRSIEWFNVDVPTCIPFATLHAVSLMCSPCCQRKKPLGLQACLHWSNLVGWSCYDSQFASRLSKVARPAAMVYCCCSCSWPPQIGRHENQAKNRWCDPRHICEQ